MAEYIASMPILPLTVGMRVQFEAVSPTTGLPVAGVTVSDAVIYATDAEGEGLSNAEVGPYMLVPGPGASTGSGTAPPLTLRGGL